MKENAKKPNKKENQNRFFAASQCLADYGSQNIDNRNKNAGDHYPNTVSGQGLQSKFFGK